LEQKRISQRQNSLSPSPPTIERTKAQQQHDDMIPSTLSSTKPSKWNSSSSARIPYATPLIRPPPKPPDRKNPKQKTPQQSNGPPTRVFRNLINKRHLPTPTQHDSRNSTPRWPNTNNAPQPAQRSTPVSQPFVPTSPNNTQGPGPIRPTVQPLFTLHLHPPKPMEGPTTLTDAAPAARQGNRVSLRQTRLSRDGKPHLLEWTTQPEVKQTRRVPGTIPISHNNGNTTTPRLQTGCKPATETMKWTQMRDFHSTTDWSSILNPQPHQSPLTGASVLEWTMLQPYSNESWRSTYAWTKELDLSQPPFYSTSMALWNLRSRHSQLRSRSNAHDQVRRYKQNPPTTGLKTPAICQDAFNKGTIRSSLQPTAGLTPTQPSTPVSDTSNKVTMAELLRRGLMDYWFPLRNANSSDGEPDIPILPLTPAAISQWYHPVPIGWKKLAKCMTSFRRWLTAIIRQRWATAWDLLTHRNVEEPQQRHGLPVTQNWRSTSHRPWPKYPAQH